MKTTRQKLGRFVRLTSIAGILSPFLLLLTGCETAEQTAMLGGLLAGNAAVANSAQQAAAYAAAAQTAGSVAQIQRQQRAAEAGRSQITVNNNSGQSSASGSGSIRDVTDEKLDGGGVYSGPMILRDDGHYTPHDFGTIRYKNGWVYRGWWSYGRKQGQGTLTSDNGRVWKGQWQAGQLSKGTFSDAEGSEYEGNFGEDAACATAEELSDVQTGHSLSVSGRRTISSRAQSPRRMALLLLDDGRTVNMFPARCFGRMERASKAHGTRSPQEMEEKSRGKMAANTAEIGKSCLPDSKKFPMATAP